MEDHVDNVKKWIRFGSKPILHFSELIPIGDTCFIVICRTNYSGDGIWKYNVSAEKWTKLIKYDCSDGLRSTDVTVDQTENIIYVSNSKQQLLEYNIKSKSKQIICNDTHLSMKKMICVNGIIHVIDINNKHYTFDEDTKIFTEKHHLNITFSGNLLHLKSQNSLCSFGIKNKQIIKTHHFDILENKWRENDIQNVAVDAAIICTTHEDYILAFAGKIDSRMTDLIFVLHVKNSRCYQSQIRCPWKHFPHVIIMRDELKDNLMVFGYVNKFIAPRDTFPHCIPDLIAKYICNEWIHVIYEFRCHFKIHIDDLLKQD